MTGIVAYVFGIIGLLTLVGFLPALLAPGQPALYRATCGGRPRTRRHHPRRAQSAGDGRAQRFPAGAAAASAIPADAFLAIFLPTLLFETALAIDIRRLMDDVAPDPADGRRRRAGLRLLSSALTLAFVFSHSILSAALLLGSIVATTDPVAVVGIFRDLGAPKRLRLLVEGESLFNDAAAIALYGLLIALLMGEHGEQRRRGRPGTSCATFIGGAVFGWAAAWAACALARWLRGLPQAEITLTVALAYLVYLFAEHYLGVSGVVAVVVAALTLSAIGRTRFTPTTWDRLENIWQQLGFWANSLIFLLAAMLVPKLVDNVSCARRLMLAVLVLSRWSPAPSSSSACFRLLSIARLAERIGTALWRGHRLGGLARRRFAGAGSGGGGERQPAAGAAPYGGRADHRLRAVHPAGQRHQPAPADQAAGARPPGAGRAGAARPRAHLGAGGYQGAAFRCRRSRQARRPARRQITEEYDRRIAAVEAQGHLTLLKPEDLVYIGLRILANHESELALTKLEDGHPAAQRRRCADRRIGAAGRRRQDRGQRRI